MEYISQFRLATFQVLNIYMRLVVTILGSETLDLSKTSKLSKCSSTNYSVILMLRILYLSQKERKNKQRTDTKGKYFFTKTAIKNKYERLLVLIKY